MDADNITIDAAVTTSAAGKIDLEAGTRLDINAALTSADNIDLDANTAANNAITLDSDLYAEDNIDVNDELELDGDVTVTSVDGNVAFDKTVGGAYTLTVDADEGTVTFGSTVGIVVDELTALTVNAEIANIGGNISTNTTVAATQADVDFTGTDAVVLTAATVTIDTDDSTDAGDAGNILFKTTGTLDGDIAGRNLTWPYLCLRHADRKHDRS
jgi:hypothetical protein